eukprot:1159798-Pelagomonas_calceolata.AAC.2
MPTRETFPFLAATSSPGTHLGSSLKHGFAPVYLCTSRTGQQHRSAFVAHGINVFAAEHQQMVLSARAWQPISIMVVRTKQCRTERYSPCPLKFQRKAIQLDPALDFVMVTGIKQDLDLASGQA